MKILKKQKIHKIFEILEARDESGFPIPDFKKFSEIGEIIGIDAGKIIDIKVFPSAVHIELFNREVLIIL